MGDERCERLVQRIRALPVGRLHPIERLVAHLEASNASLATVDGPPGARRDELHDYCDADGLPQRREWPHAPLHRLSEHGTFIVTGGTLLKEHYFRGPQRLDLLESTLLAILKDHGWRLEAWAVFSNHYHFVAHAELGAMSLKAAVKRLHGRTAFELNGLDNTPQRAVWYNYWDTKLTFEKSYFARLNYVHQNAVKHGLVPVAARYRWCSAGWFERTATRAQVGTIYSFRTDRVKIQDDYEPV